MQQRTQPREVALYLDRLVGRRTPGLQYVALNAKGPLLSYCGGTADPVTGRPAVESTGFHAYSMTKTVTAAAVLLLAERKALRLDDSISRFTDPGHYGPSITIRQLLTHTAGVPNPLPLRWAHPAFEHDRFEETAGLRAVLRANPRLCSVPGSKFRYSNIGYWLLGDAVAKVAGMSFGSFVRGQVLQPLGIEDRDVSTDVPDWSRHARGCLERFSAANLFKKLLFDPELIGSRAGRWVMIEPHIVNRVAFGGLTGNARGFASFLLDQLRERPLLWGEDTRELFFEQQYTNRGDAIPMTLGWHIGTRGGMRYYFKEGGGGGYRSMMRVYRSAGIATVILANAAGFPVRQVLDWADSAFL